MKPFIAELAKPENHWKRNALKWLQNIASGGAIGSYAAGSPTAIVVSVVAFLISKFIEGSASKHANESRRGPEPVHAEDEESFERPRYREEIFTRRGKLTRLQKETRAACGLPTDEEYQAEVRRIDKAKPKPSYRVRIRQPGKRSKFIECKSLSEAKKLVKIEVASEKHPAGTVIEIIPPLK